jgi:hypothetical protein
MTSLEKQNYAISKIILSKEEPFTLCEILNEAKKVGLDIKNESRVKYILKRYRDDGIIVEQGPVYYVSPLFEY